MRTLPEYDGYSRQPLRTTLGYVDSSGSSSSSPSSSKPAGRIQAREHVELSSSSWQNKDRQNNERGTAVLSGSPRPSRTATQHVKGELRGEDVSWTAAGTYKQSMDQFPVSDAQTTIWEGQKNRNRVFNFLSGSRRARGQGDDNGRRRASLQRVVAFLDSSGVMQSVQSSRPQLQTRAESHSPPGVSTLPCPSSTHSRISSASSIETIKSTSSSRPGNRRSPRDTLSSMEHMHPQITHANTGDGTHFPSPQPLPSQAAASAFQTPTHIRTQNIGGQNPSDHAASSPREVWPTSPPSHYSFDGLGLLTSVASPCRQPLPLSPAAQSFPTSPVNRLARNTDVQSPIRNTKSSPNGPEQAQASSPHQSVATPEDAQSDRTRPTNRGSLSHHVSLPLSPASSASNSSTRLQVQPGHRRTPRMSLYPSLVSEDSKPLSSYGLNVVFGLPTPGLSPIQTLALIRSPFMDPHSLVPSQMQIPGDIVGLLRAFLHSSHDLAIVSFSWSFLFLRELSFLVVLRLLRIMRE
jgi:hypothetical protein